MRLRYDYAENIANPLIHDIVLCIIFGYQLRFSRFDHINAEFSKYHVQYENIDNYLKQNSDCSQQLNRVIRWNLKDMNVKPDSFRDQINIV
jgi:hypothetical protein